MISVNNIGKIAKELNTLLKYIPNLKKEKISKKFLKFLEEHEDKTYKFEIDLSKKLSEQNVMKETRILFIAIYRDFFASEEEKKEIDRKLIENDKKYDINNIFEKRKKKPENTQANIQLVEYKKKSFQKLIDFFKKNKILDIGRIIKLEDGKKYITLLKCNIKGLDYYLICNQKDENDIMVIQNQKGSEYIKIIKDYNQIKKALEKMTIV